MKIYIILLSTLILFIGCDKETNPLEPDSFNDEIIGKWKSNRQILCFYKDYTYTDSLFDYISITDSLPKLSNVTNGIYSIEGNILQFEDFHITYLDSNILGISSVPFSKEICLLNDSLILTSVKILDLIQGTNNELWGTWTETSYTYHCKNNPIEIQYKGRQKYTYKFLKDTSIVEYKCEYIDDESKQPPE